MPLRVGYNTRMRAVALASVFASLVAVSAASGTTPAPNVRGVVVRATGMGGCYQGEPCDPLPPAMFVVFSRDNVVKRSRLAANGSFAVHLAPGQVHGHGRPAARVADAGEASLFPEVGTLHPRLVERHR